MPLPSQAFGDENIADRSLIAVDDPELATEAIFIPGGRLERERTRIEDVKQPLFRRKPSSRSRSHLGGLSSGVSMSAIRIFSPRNQNVSPSTTQVIRCPLPQIEKASLTLLALLEGWAEATDARMPMAKGDRLATAVKSLNVMSPQCLSSERPYSSSPRL
ncbi:hypothetical protein J5289_28615 (plasmid) [Rhizobium sp. B230/85]|nr:hypothetical protein [Rhizobium sp. B209b/85]QXZ99778.1 hypothetical protein J5289_28615 [Rhizobium sp. B230/85]